MIKGTNKRIIEITGEDGSCFERIVLFLRPQQDEESQAQVLKMAEDYADGLLKSGAPVSLLSETERKSFFSALSPRTFALAALGLLVAGGLVALCIALL